MIGSWSGRRAIKDIEKSGKSEWLLYIYIIVMMLNFLTLIYAVIFRDKVLGCKQGTLKRVNKNKLEIFRVIFILGARRQKKLGLSSVLQWISASASWLEAEKIDGEKLRRSLSWQLAEKNKKMTWKGTQD